MRKRWLVFRVTHSDSGDIEQLIAHTNEELLAYMLCASKQSDDMVSETKGRKYIVKFNGEFEDMDHHMEVV